MAKLTPAQMKKAVEEFKKQFTGGFYHGSPSNKIKAFDSSKAKDPDFATPGVTFVTRDPDFAESFLPMTERGLYKSGATMYPVNVKLGKHFDPETKTGKKVLEQYIEKTESPFSHIYDSYGISHNDGIPLSKMEVLEQAQGGDWKLLESPDFLNYLRSQGHDSIKVVEGGIPNVGIFKPENIRGKFAKFNPEDADSPDFMKAEGGAVEGYAPGGKVGALTELMKLITQQGGTAAAKRLEKAADLVPNLENKFQPKALERTFTGDNARAVMVMKPGDFEKYAMPISKEASEYKGYRIGDVYGGNHDQLPKGELEDYLKYLESVKQSGGFKDVPFLHLGQLPNRSFPNIQGHEGRHRMRALDKSGDESALVEMIPTPNLREPFPRRSQEEYLEALQEKIGRRPFVTPEQTEEGVSRGLIELPEMFAPGGAVKAAKKFLEHARSVPFVHYSQSPNISTLDPNMYGRGIKGAEAGRLKEAPDIRPRSYIYTEAGGRKPEQGLGPHKYSGVAEDMYPLHEDPAGYSAIAKQRAIDPYMMSMGREMVDEKAHLNELERLIKGAGYKGYANDDVGLLFHPTDVTNIKD
jgi:hypothetical protein